MGASRNERFKNIIFLTFSLKLKTLSFTSVSSPDHLISPSGPGATARGSLGSPPGLPGSLGQGQRCNEASNNQKIRDTPLSSSFLSTTNEP